MRKLLIIPFTIILLFFAFYPAKVKAFTVAPALSDLSVKPGEIKNIDIILNNTDKIATKFWPEVVDITFNEEGVAQFMPNSPKTDSNNRLLSKWIRSTEGSITLASGKQTSYRVTLKIPPQAEIGRAHV